MTTKKKDAPEASVNSSTPYGPIEKDNTAVKVVLFVVIGFGLFFVVLLMLIFNVFHAFLNFSVSVEDHGPDGGNLSVMVDGDELHISNGFGDGVDINDMSRYAISFEEGSVSVYDKVSNLSLYGYTMSAEDANKNVEAQSRVDNLLLTKGDAGDMKISVLNRGDSEAKANECVLVGVEFSMDGISVYGDIKIGSTVNDVKSVFGEPSNVTATENGGVMRYEESSSESNYYEFTIKDGKVSNIKWQVK